MKKILIVMAALFVCAIDANAIEVAGQVEVCAERAVSAELHDEANAGFLYLYGDGTCVVRYEDGRRSTGTYDISGSTIYITWANGSQQQGYCRFVEGQLKSVSVEGYTFSRRVVVRRR